MTIDEKATHELKEVTLQLLKSIPEDELTQSELDELYFIYLMFKRDRSYRALFILLNRTHARATVNFKDREFLDEILPIMKKYFLEGHHDKS